MLILKNINISFNQESVLNAEEFHAKQGNITCITGDSGSGKTTFLYMIGLLAYYENCFYTYQGKEINTSDSKCVEKFRHEHISYVLQDNNVVESITVRKNIEFMLTMNTSTTLSVNEILEKVLLQDKKDVYPSSLSGGEKQRLAFACAIAKGTEIFIGDEITSSLDEESKMIIFHQLQEMAKANKTVIIVSHDLNIIDQCDCIYNIEDKQLKLLQDSYQENVIDRKSIKKTNMPFLDNYLTLFLSNKKFIVKKFLYTCIISILIFASLSIIYVANQTNKNLMEQTNAISNLELFLMNQYDFEVENEVAQGMITNSDGNGKPAFDDDVNNQINLLNNVTANYEVYNFKSMEMNINSGRTEAGEVKVYRNQKEIMKREFSEEELRNGYTYNYNVKPYFKEQSWFKEGNNGVYVNQEFAHTFNVEKGDLIHMKVFVPVAILISDGTYYPNEICEEVNESTRCEPSPEGKVDFDNQQYVYYPIEMKYPVLDIINTVNSSGGYMLQNSIYLDYNSMMKIINEYKINNFDEYEKTGVWYGSFASLKSSVRILFADKYQSIPKIQEEIKAISNNIAIGYDYQDLENLYTHLNSETSLSIWYSIALIIFVLILTIFLGYQQIKNYRSQILIMKVNGVMDKRIQRLFTCDSCMNVVYVMILIMLIYLIGRLPFLYFDPMKLPEWYLNINYMIAFPPIYLALGSLMLSIITLCVIILYHKVLKYEKIEQLLRGRNDTN